MTMHRRRLALAATAILALSWRAAIAQPQPDAGPVEEPPPAEPVEAPPPVADPTPVAEPPPAAPAAPEAVTDPAIPVEPDLTLPARPEMDRNFAGSIQLDYMAIPT